MPGDKTALPLLQTKLHRPHVVTNHLHRQRLLDRLNRHRQRPLTLVSAPAGYGKSMLVSCWLETCDIPVGWISLDENDNDLRVFTTYFIAAVKRLFPRTCRKTHTMINGPNLPPAADLAFTLLNELDRITQPCIMVLDDYHLIKETVVHDLLTELLKHPLQSFHLVIIGRQDPLLPISRLRAKSLVTEVRTNDLRFNERETAELLRLVTGNQIGSHIVATLREKTEGWVTGLCLAAISMRLKDNPELISLDPIADAHYVMEYLFNEVLAKQPPRICEYLLGTAILDRFCAPLCEAVCAPGTQVSSCEDGGWEYIAWLKKENLFLIPLDDGNRWFRFHHLFRKLLLNHLKRRFSAEDINALHDRASVWFADNGMIEDAVRHALAAGDETGAAQLVVQNRQAAVNAERWFELEKWLSILPEGMIQQQPELLLAKAWIHYYHYDYGFIPAVLERAESLLSNHPHRQPLSGEINLFKGIAFVFQGDGALSLQYIEDALGQIPAAHHYTLAAADQFWAVAGQMQGQKERIVAKLTDLLQNQPLEDVRKIRVMAALVTVHIFSGDLTVAFNLGKQLKNFAISINSNAYIAWSSYFIGLIHFCRNELDKSIDHLGQAAELGHMILRRANVDCLGGLALAYQAKQLADKATAFKKRLDEYVQSLEKPDLLDIAHSFAARLSLMKGKVPMSSGLTGRKWRSNAGPMFFWMEIPDITQCRVLLAAGSDTDLQEAENMLKACLQLSQAQHNTFQSIFILPLLASVYEKHGRLEEALNVLEEAVNLAVPGGFIRPFIESGPTAADLLKRLAEKGIASDYIGHLLDAFSPPTHQPSPIAQTSDGPLTNREHDILELLAQRLRNKEIAENLLISTHTVNAHLKNLYSKLDAHDRRQAVAMAKKLGIL
jgi:LuxR family maltose regulon positive regulatory protein